MHTVHRKCHTTIFSVDWERSTTGTSFIASTATGCRQSSIYKIVKPDEGRHCTLPPMMGSEPNLIR
jgi:hypothetical protein